MNITPWRTATLSECGTYRYGLTRSVSALAVPPPRKLNLGNRPTNTLTGTVLFVMLNPSTADGNKDDNTIRKCIKYAAAWGFAQLEVVNLFAFRATHPTALPKAADPIGPENDEHILRATERARKIILAYGTLGWKAPRDKATMVQRRGTDVFGAICRQREILPEVIELSKYGQPRHPLYLLDAARPFPVTRDHAFGYVRAR